MCKLTNNMKKIMLAGKKNEKKRKKVKKNKKANSPMDSSFNDMYKTSDRICNSVSIYPQLRRAPRELPESDQRVLS